MSDAALGVWQQFLQLPADDQRRLLAECQAAVQFDSEIASSRSILELRGLGKEVWQGGDAQRDVDEERASWDG